jgi:hypothetical protein
MNSPVLKLACFLLLGAQAAVCCSVQSLKLQQVASDFTVVATHRKNPIAGIRIEIQPKGKAERVVTEETNEAGEIRVTGLPVGEYFVSASHADIEAGTQWIEVVAVPDDKTKSRLAFEWADWSYKTKRVAGTLTGLVPGDSGNPLMDIVHPKETIYPGVAISLRNAFGTEEYRTVSDSSGGFAFDHIPDGIYLMTIEGGMKSVNGTGAQTTLVIDLAAASSRDFLPLRLQDDGCGSVEFALREN